MPTVQVLPNTSTSSGAYWTYSNLPPALAHTNSLLPSGSGGSRGPRAKRNNNAESSAARQRQINSRILDLERDNYKDMVIPIPTKPGKALSARTRGYATANVRRILASQKTFANHLANEEALADSGSSGNGGGGGSGGEEKQKVGYTSAAALPSSKPKRVFCETCGYWGRYRCQKCSARFCGLECGAVHSETKCNKFYA
jgi:zinc finger HIT domain-containing protein 1